MSRFNSISKSYEGILRFDHPTLVLTGRVRSYQDVEAMEVWVKHSLNIISK